MREIIQFGSYIYPTLHSNSEIGGAARQSMLEQSSNGAIDTRGTGPSPFQGSSLTKSFRIITSNDTDFSLAVKKLTGQMMLSQNDFRFGQRLLISLIDGVKYATYAKCINATYGKEYFNDNFFWMDVQQDFEQTNPKWWVYEQTLFLGDNLGTLGDAATAGYTFGQSVTVNNITTNPATFTLTNNGNSRIFNGLIEFRNEFNTPIVTNLRNKYTFTVNRTFVTDDRYTINPLTRDVKFNGSPGYYPDLDIGSLNGQLQPMVLEPGDNDFIIITTGTPTGEFKYYFADTSVI